MTLHPPRGYSWVHIQIQDEKQPEQDRVVTRHILETHAPGCTADFPDGVPVVSGAGVGALWTLDKLRAYVAVVKRQFAPVLTPEAEELLGAYYASQRRAEGQVAHAARTTIRMLESLVRLAQVRRDVAAPSVTDSMPLFLSGGS
jgi:DNA replicative helicase MCM subunit Mcm2 (Cdc46/Mcm family)